ncbi:hypothetical protein EWH12_21850 [Sphingobium cupriresistens]|uniref:Uncharacterized protein n=1 Tax=Sphingobium cupriresistens TaxID=1132417 RepID=A0A8G2DUR6_9SPHN|nr:hypothetical protein EWH12_21850 [Sphingobium cupriresistens]
MANMHACSDGKLKCAWYHSVTSRDAEVSRRGALNQHLHVVRDLLRLANANKDLGFLKDYASYGLNQLFIGGEASSKEKLPTFVTFLGPAGPGGIGALLTYGFDAKASGMTTYFLGAPQKNCHYAVHDLGLLSSILKQPAMANSYAATKALACGSPVFKADSALRAVEAMGYTGSEKFVCDAGAQYSKSEAGKFFTRHFSTCSGG